MADQTVHPFGEADYPVEANVANGIVYAFGTKLGTKIPMLPKTGQTSVYETGDDGTYQAGNPVNPRFVDNSNGTITDNATGLMWVKNTSLIIPGAVGVHATNQIQVAQGDWVPETPYAAADVVHDAVGGLKYVCAVGHTSGSVDFATDLAAHPTYWRQTVWVWDANSLNELNTFEWAPAIANCEALEYAGYSDWRMPNIRELRSLVDYTVYEPAINSTYFYLYSTSICLSSTTVAMSATLAWAVKFQYGLIQDVGKSSDFYGVIPVRGGQIV